MAIIEDCVDPNQNIKAKNDGYEFIDVNDIKSNLHLLKGEPEISIGRLRINLGGSSPKLRYYQLKNEEDIREEMEALAVKLVSRLAPFKRLLNYEKYRFVLMMLLSIPMMFGMVMISKTWILPSRDMFLSIALSGIMFMPIWYVGFMVIDGVVPRVCVSYSSRETWFARNGAKLLRDASLLFLGALINWAFGLL